jgi:protein gp37
MSKTSRIEWTERTWNPLAGCAMVSPGCTNCYAMRMAARLERMGQAKYIGTTRRSGSRAVNFDRRALQAPLAWRRPARIFVNSMSDLFHEAVDVAVVRRIWDVMRRTPWHTYQVLTKRPERMRDITAGLPLLPNVWLGATVESEETAHRLDILRETPAALRFVSFEPLIDRVTAPDLAGIAWAIVGGESGPGARDVTTRQGHGPRAREPVQSADPRRPTPLRHRGQGNACPRRHTPRSASGEPARRRSRLRQTSRWG